MHPRRHPLFPTIAEVNENPELAYSDHLPIYARTQHCNILSLNTLGPSALSGLHAAEQWETDDETRQRYRRIVDGIGNAVRQRQVDVIALQETVPDFIVPILSEVLGEAWAIIPEPRVGMVTCYNKNKFKLTSSGKRIHTAFSLKLFAASMI